MWYWWNGVPVNRVGIVDQRQRLVLYCGLDAQWKWHVPPSRGSRSILMCSPSQMARWIRNCPVRWRVGRRPVYTMTGPLPLHSPRQSVCRTIFVNRFPSHFRFQFPLTNQMIPDHVVCDRSNAKVPTEWPQMTISRQTFDIPICKQTIELATT